MNSWTNTAFTLVPLIAMVFSVFSSPYTKVEESFHMQAAHDFLYVRNLSKWDHHEYPGVVPRTFVGAAVIAGGASPVVRVLDWLWVAEEEGGHVTTRLYAQYVVRIVMAAIVWRCMAHIGFALDSMYPHWAPLPSRMFSLLQVTSFHLVFYSSRTLSNTFALTGTSIGFSLLLSNRPILGFLVYGINAVVFRADSALLAATLGLFFVFELKKITIPRAILVVLAGLVGGVLICVPLDSLLWRRLVLAEYDMLHYNVYLNKSHNWGTSPFHWYFTSALPRAMLTNVFLLALSYLYVPSFRVYTRATLLFVFLYSFLPHKELRFIIYAIPMFHAHIAIFLSGIASSKLKLRNLVLFIFGMMMVANCVANVGFHYVSSWNYPGGYALKALAQREVNNTLTNNTVHLDTLVCMTGATRFTKIHSPHWQYSKDPTKFVLSNTTEDVEHYASDEFTHVVASMKVPSGKGRQVSMHDSSGLYEAIARINAYVDIDWHGFLLRTEPLVGVYRRKKIS